MSSDNGSSTDGEVWFGVLPKPGFCVKLKTTSGDEKVFVNCCSCDELPAPRQSLDDAGLAAILESSDPGSFRIPISLGPPRSEKDKSGNACTVYDCLINSKFYEDRVKTSELFKTFLVAITTDAIESKYGQRLKRDGFVILQNKKYLGEVQTQNIRKQPPANNSSSHALITELSSISVSSGKGSRTPSASASSDQLPNCKQDGDTLKTASQRQTSKSLKIQEKSKSDQVLAPEYTITKPDGQGGEAGKVLIEVKLPGIVCAKQLELSVGCCRLILNTAMPVKYHLDLLLDFDFDQDSVEANLHQDLQVLRLVLRLI